MSGSAHVAFHDAECGGYRDDLALWRRLAGRAGGPVLDLGCGTGRVALELARAGHHVWALDHDAELLGELAACAAADGLRVETVCADCRELDLVGAFPLIIAPMQLVQLLGGPAGRRRLLDGVRRHLAPGGEFAAAIIEGVPPGVIAGAGDALPDVRERGGWVYSSLPLGAAIAEGAIEVRRLRQVVSPSGELSESVHTDCLDLLDAASLEAEAAGCGLAARERIEVPAGESHVGSTVVVLGRAG